MDVRNEVLKGGVIISTSLFLHLGSRHWKRTWSLILFLPLTDNLLGIAYELTCPERQGGEEDGLGERKRTIELFLLPEGWRCFPRGHFCSVLLVLACSIFSTGLRLLENGDLV